MIFNSDDFNTLQENALIALLTNDELQMEETEIWDKVIQWGKARTPDLPSNLEEWIDVNFKSLKTTLQHCLPHIRYFQIPSKDVLGKIQPYQNILEKNLWVDILTKYLDPDKYITSPILPPRKKATKQLPPRKKATKQLPPRNVSIISPTSSIITLKHVAEISSWIDRRSTIYNTTEIPYEFKLLLRGSRDGFSGEVFHKLCDNIASTVVVVKINRTNEILGGYNPLIWKFLNGGYELATTADSFIFSLKNGALNQSILSRVKNTSCAIYNGGMSQGPWFSANDLGMGSDPLKKWHCGNKYYEKPISNTNGWFFYR